MKVETKDGVIEIYQRAGSKRRVDISVHPKSRYSVVSMDHIEAEAVIAAIRACLKA